MLKRIVSGIMLTLLFIGVLAFSFNIQLVKTQPATIIVPHDYATIQEAINAATPEDTIFAYNGTYYENVIVNKTVSLVGENRNSTIIDGGQISTVISVEVSNVSIRGFTVQNSGPAFLDSGIWLKQDSFFGDIRGNYITNNSYGIYLYDSDGNVMVDNNIAKNKYGIMIKEHSDNNVMDANNVTDNKFAGIRIEWSSDNTINANNLTNNEAGISLQSSYGNKFYHNNFNNTSHQISGDARDNVWDNGYPSGGNYWSNYTGTDLFSGTYQNETGSDRIGDSPYVIDQYKNDSYPLMNQYVAIYDVAVTNVTISEIEVRQGDYFLDISVTVENVGDSHETFNVTTYFNSSVIDTTKFTSFSPHAKKTLTIPWNVTEVEEPGIYTIKAVADTVPNEANTTNNEYEDGAIRLYHNIAVIDIMPFKTVVCKNCTMNITATVENQGDYPETFNITAYANLTFIVTQNITLLGRDSKSVVFVWDTSGFVKGNFNISVTAESVPNEIDPEDNTKYADQKVNVTILGDVIFDRKVDLKDEFAVRLAYGAFPGHPRWNPNLDINNDCKVDLKDYFPTCLNYGKVDP